MLVFICPAGAEATISTPQGEYPTCESGGQWVEHTPSIWQQPIDGESFGDLLAATVAILIGAYAIRTVSNLIRNRR